MKKIATALLFITLAGQASAYTSTNCFWIGSTYTCTTYGGGGMTTTRCFMIGGMMRCTSY
jgi:hypothetical protein